MTKKLIILYCGFTIILIAMMVAYGYTIGHENSIQLVPFAQYISDHSLFSKDFFTQSARDFPNERSFFLLLLEPFGMHQSWVVFIYYIVFNLILLHALYRIAFFVLGNSVFSFIALILLLFPLNYHTLGLNELTGRDFNSSIASESLGAWAIYYFISNRRWQSYTLCILATAMHPLSGMQVFLLIFGTRLLFHAKRRIIISFLKSELKPVALYLLTGGVFIYFLRLRLNDISWDADSFFHTFFVFRNAHHYLPSHYPLSDWIMLTPFYIAAPFLLWRKQKQLSIFSALIIIGCIKYTIGVLAMHSTVMASLQWFKTTMWLEFFAVIAVLHFIADRISAFNKHQWRVAALCLTLLVAVGWVVMIFPGYKMLRSATNYEFPFWTKTTPEIDICEKAGALTPKDALFLQPCSLEELKYYGERSTVIDYKAITHKKSYLKEWSDRFNAIYQVDPVTSQVVSFDAIPLADENFRNLSADQFLALKNKYGVTHIVTFSDVHLPFTVLASNEKYQIYAL